MEGWQVFFEIPGKPPVELREGDSVIGRSRQSAVHIPETTVSRQHAKVAVRSGGEVRISDLESSNGTFVNGDKVELERKLADGDRVLVGDAELIIRILPPIEPSEATVRVSIPPLGGPAPAPAAPVDLPLVPPAPVVPMPRPVAVPPPPRPAVAATVAAAPFGAPAVAAAPLSTPRPAGDVLPSIQEIDKLPLPPPAPRRSSGPITGPVAAAAATPAAALRPAGFWIRVLAYLIDVAPAMVIAVAAMALSFVVDPTLGMVVNLLVLPYVFWTAWMLPATKGTTLGKKMLGLAVVSERTRPGQGLGWGKAFVRLLGYAASSAVLGIGYLLIAFTSRKQGLHDMIAGTYVVRAR